MTWDLFLGIVFIIIFIIIIIIISSIIVIIINLHSEVFTLCNPLPHWVSLYKFVPLFSCFRSYSLCLP